MQTVPFLILSILGFPSEYEARKIAEDQRGGDAPGGCFQCAGQRAQQSLPVNRLANALGNGKSKACEGDGGSRPCKINDRLVNSKPPEDDACDHVNDENARGRELGFIH